VKVASETKLDDEFAKQLGLSDLEQLRAYCATSNGKSQSRPTHMKRRLLDQLAAGHDFDVPPSMVEAEYQNIMAQLRQEGAARRIRRPRSRRSRPMPKNIAALRSVAWPGLLLSEIRRQTYRGQPEMNRLVGQAAAQYQPGP
jgi:trigger factor